MISSRIILSLLIGIFLMNFASAIVVYGTWEGDIQSATITEGESITFNSKLLSANPPITLSVKIFDSSNTMIHSFIDTTISENNFYNDYTVTSSIYNGAGNYKIVILGSDSKGTGYHTLSLTVNPVTDTPDTTAPIITLLGTNAITIEVGSSYTDSDATAYDNIDGDITSQITIINSVNVNILGSYTVTYNVIDSSGNAAIQITRTVNVVDTTIPIITLTGDSTQAIEVGDSYTELGATAIDNYDGALTSSIVITSTVNANIVGSYTVTYNVIDSSGNAAIQITRTVNVNNKDGNGNDNEDNSDSYNYYEEIYLKQLKTKVPKSETIYLQEYKEKELSWFQKLIDSIVNFFRKLFGN